MIDESVVPLALKSKLPKITVHGSVAAFLSDKESMGDRWQAWERVLPTVRDFEGICPIMWPESLQKLLNWSCKSEHSRLSISNKAN
jgi:hypothetical protein